MVKELQFPVSQKPHPTLCYGLAMAVLLSLFTGINSSVDWLPGYDGYFHIRYSQLLGQQGFIDKLPWLHFTIRADSFRDHHLLWHYLLIPFTVGDLITGGKIATTLFTATAGLACYALMRAAGVVLPLLWTLTAFFASHPFLYRMSLLRVQSISLALMLVAVLLCVKKKTMPLAVLAAVFVWTYDGFSLLILTGACFLLASRLTEGSFRDRSLAAILSGIAIGLVVNPYFPENIGSLVYNLARSILHDVPQMQLGGEWAPYDSWHLFTSSLPAWLALFATVLFLPLARSVHAHNNDALNGTAVRQEQHAQCSQNIERHEYAILLLSLVFLVLALKSRRFMEYWPVFSVLAASLIIGRRIRAKQTFIAFVCILPLLGTNFIKARAELSDSLPPTLYQGSAEWLAGHSQPGEIVFHADWDDFPFLFFYNQQNHYILGLDPMYMYSKNPDKYRLYQKITKGKIDHPARVIQQEFDSRFIFLDRREHRDLYEKLKADENARLAYEDDGGLVFVVIGEMDTIMQREITAPKPPADVDGK